MADHNFTVESGITRVFLDLPTLESAAGLTLTSANSPIDNLDNQQRKTLFTFVDHNGANIIAADYYQQVTKIIGYSVKTVLF